MSFIPEYISLIDLIVQKSKESKIFIHVCQISASILEEIKKEIILVHSEINQDDILQLNEYIQKFLDVIQLLGYEEQVKIFLNSQDPINTPVTEINQYLIKTVDILRKYDILKSIEIPINDSLLPDYYNIREFLTNQDPEIIKKRQEEIDSMIEQIQDQTNDTNQKSIDDDIISTLNRFPNYKLNESDYKIKDYCYTSNPLFTCYYGEKTNGSKEKLRVIALHDKSKFKRVFSILSTIRHPYIETFVGACLKGDDVELVTKKSGVILNKLFHIDDSFDDSKSDDFYDDSEQSTVYLDTGDRTIIAFKIAQVMAFIHSQGIFHRDLSSSNICIKKVTDKEDDMKYEIFPIIINFANSRLLNDDSIIMTIRNNDSSLTSFIAPELIDTPKYDEKVDVFAFSGILYELLTGKSPIEAINGFDGNEHWKKVKKGIRPNLPDNISDELRVLIESCWSQDPKERPSFDKIINFMLPKENQKMVIFPDDEENEEAIKKFYNQFIIMSKSCKDCLDTFEKIKGNIESSYLYKNEFFNAFPIINNYQYILRNSKYSQTKNLNDEENSKILNLSQNLNKLNEIISSALNISNVLIDFKMITNKFKECMDNIFQSMQDLNFEVVEKYKENDKDLALDYRQILNELQEMLKQKDDQINERIDQRILQQKSGRKLVIEKKKEIENFLNQEGIKDAFNSQIKKSLSQYSQFEKKEEDFIIDDSDQISSGVTSVVRRGWYSITDEEVAIKILNENYLKIGESSLVYLSQEIAILIHLKHEYIAEFIGYVIPKNENSVWLVTKFIENGSLFDIKKDLTPFQKTKIAFEIAEAMEYIHSNSLLHRDLKTENVLIDGDFSPKIIDFGVARSDISDIKKTSKCGTFNYMAPEVIDGGDYGTKADVFSYGLILWEMVNNEEPFGTFSKEKIQEKIRRCAPLKFKGKCPQNLKDLIKSCYSKDKDKRPSFTQIIEKMMDKDNYIMFNGADENEVKKFYEEKEQKREKMKIKDSS